MLTYQLTTAAMALVLAAPVVTAIEPPDRTPHVVDASDGRTLVVALDGSAEFDSIGAAVAAASDGDSIVVRPGVYAEALVIDKDITLTGDGAPGDIVISVEGLSGTLLTVREADAIVSGLTLTGPEAYVHVVGGSPALDGLVLDGLGSEVVGDEACHALFGPTGCNALSVDLEATDATLSGSTLRDSGQIWVREGGSPSIEGNELSGGAHIFLERFDDETVVRGNTITGAEHAAIAIFASGRPLIEGNVIEGAGTSGIEVGLHLEPGIEPTIRSNTISDNPTGIEVASGALPTIEDNTFSGNASAIVIAGGNALVRGNHLVDNSSGVFVMRGAPVLEDNEITGGEVGLGLGSDAAEPVLRGNRICGTRTSVNLIFGAEMPATDSNEICPDESSE